jgi:hypothetical protein
VGAAGAGAVEPAGVADAALAAAGAARPGEDAAGARADRFAITLTITGRHGRVRHNRPGLFMFVGRIARLRKPADDGCTGLP